MNKFIIATIIFLSALTYSATAQVLEPECEICVDPTLSQSDTTFVVFDNNEATITLTKKASQTLYVIFYNGDNHHLEGSITAGDQMANVRFTQILMPDGSADGPFSRDIDYDLPQKGRYTLLLGENIMAGDPWEGKFTVILKISKK